MNYFRSSHAAGCVVALLLEAATFVDAIGKKKAQEPPAPPPLSRTNSMSDLEQFYSIVAAVVLAWASLWLLTREKPAPTKKKCDVVIVCCGQPGRGMGWYHATNLLNNECPSANLSDVVEPWFLGGGASSQEAQDFNSFRSANPSVRFHKSLDDLPHFSSKAGIKTVVLIAGRTVDNPQFLRAAVDKGAAAIYLEKPGAPSVTELESCGKYARAAGVPVYLGYNKNVTKYVSKALSAEVKAGPGASTAFYHNNTYTKATLPECFERNSEGMLKNMAVHELAILVTFYGVTSTNIVSVVPDKKYSSCQTIGKYTDFDKLGFTVTTKEGKKASVYADRCGGSLAEAVVSDGSGKEVTRIVSPDEELNAIFERKSKERPTYMPYFLLQHDDYVTLKERVCAAVNANTSPPGVASLEIAVETLKVAEYLTPILQKELLGKKK